MMRLTLILVLSLTLSACGSSPATKAPAASAAPAPWPPSVGSVDLARGVEPLLPQLDITIETFATGLDTALATDSRVFAEVRKAEAFYMPVQLRNTLERSGYWGVVRVVPRVSDAAALSISGRIIHADGHDLVLDIKAEDAAGRVWLEQRYHDSATASDYPVAEDGEPFADLYRQIANDLLRIRGEQAVAALPDTALLRFANVLAPGVFVEYLGVDAEGHLEIRRLPAAGDPMVERVQRLRRQEYLFVDAADEQYLELVAEFGPTYDLWRQYARELAVYESDYLSRAGEREIEGRRGTFNAMQQTYNTFRRVKVHEQDLYDLAVGFDNEVTSTVMDVDDRVYRLSGSLDTQYNEWRGILSRIFAIESGAE